jgi:formylglycine-generating enzyme required for sulfatase activity
MRKMAGMAVAAILLLAAGMAQADFMIDTVRVGNAGNAGEWSGESYGGNGPNLICGAVGYAYNIGKYEVTAGQYKDFLNAVAGVDMYALYNTNMWSSSYGCKIERYAGSGTSGNPYQYRVAADWANRPVNYVSWGDSVRFANWLTNGQGNGSTETGAYNLSGAMADADLLAVVVPTASERATWSTGAKPYFLLTSEDEWYKAAYHDKDAALAATYFDYPTSSNSVPSNDLVKPTDPGNNATFYDRSYTIGTYYRTEVGEHENSDSPYGTFDQGGNVWEWNEAVIYACRGLRGGSFSDEVNLLLASYRYNSIGNPAYESSRGGFRVSEVPEPASMAVLVLGSIGMLLRRRKLGR